MPLTCKKNDGRDIMDDGLPMDGCRVNPFLFCYRAIFQPTNERSATEHLDFIEEYVMAQYISVFGGKGF